MARIDEIKSLFDRICNTNLTTSDKIPDISSEDMAGIVKLVDDAKAEVERLHILDIINKVCR